MGEGVDSLSAAERSELTRFLQRMERALTTTVDTNTKNALRAKAREDFYDIFHPHLKAVLRDADGSRYDVHHLIPLEYTHLFPELDINAASNLTALGKPVHKSINKAWNLFRKEFGDTARPEQVRRMADITRKHFDRWFNQPYEPSQSDVLLEKATAAVIEEVSTLFATQ